MTNKRLVDLVFGEDEKLWRRIERKQVTRDKRVKASALRLQISVVREKYGAQATVTEGKFNGIAEITASRAAQVVNGAVRAVCVDEPHDTNPGNALIAFVATPGEAVSEDLVNATRALLAERFTIVVDPQPVQ